MMLERLQNTPQLSTTLFTFVLCRTRHNTIDTIVIQRDANTNKLRGILQFSHDVF